jgi:hypothetical protein
MVKLSGLSKLFSRLSCVGLGVALIGVMYLSVDAKTVTIDADGTATYKSLDLFLSSINNAGESTIPDTVLFTGLNQHTYSCSTNFYIQSITKTILFIGGTSDPDKFPIINHTNYNSYGFFQSAPVKFERLIFTGSVSFDNGQGAKPLAFSKCVVRNYKSSFFDFAGNGAQNIMFDNCLFVNNTDTIFKLNFWTADTRVAFINCTFDRNKGIFGGNSVSGVTNFVLRNNIFINNASISKFTNIITKIQNSLTSEALTTGYDASNAQIFAADTTTLFLKTNRATDTLPSAWKIGSSSKAKNYGTFYTGVTTDIAGDLRAITKVDAGCWAVDNSVQFVVQPKPDTVVQEKTATFIAAVTNPEGVSYRWHRIGSTDTLGVKDTLSITATAALDSARIYCVASNAQATQSSDTVMLRVVTAPVIVGDAASRIIVPNGGSKTFAVTAKGLQLRYYWYIDNNKVASDSSKPELTIASVTKDAYQNKTIYCEISNDFSTVKTLSDTIIVSDNLPVITTDLKDIATYAGSNARFKIVATHATPLKYIWFKTSPAGEKTIIAGASSADSLILTNIALADSNSKIECYVVSVVEDTAKSRAAALIVKSVPKPKITAQSGASIETREGTSLSLFIEHTAIEGVTDTIKWYHVGTLVKNETLKTLTIANVTKANEGVYFCVLSNSGGSVKSAEIKVTIRGESDVYNPIQLSGQLIDRGNVRVTIRNFSNLPSSPDNDRYVDTIGVWWMTNTSVPGKPNMSSTRLMKYSLAELVSSSGGADTVTVTIPVALGDDACDTLLFLSTPFWRKPDSLPPFNTGIGAKVYSCGAKNLVNTLTITKVNQIKDTVVIKVSGFGSLQKSDASYAVIYYGEKTEKSSYTLKNDKFPAESDNLTFVNSDFQTVENSVNWSVYLRSTNGSYSDTVTKPIKIGFSPPPNDATLIIDSTNAYNAYLSWSLSTPADSIAIVFSKSKIEVGTVITDTAAFKKIIVNGFETNSMIDGLKASTVYYFALLKKKNGIWSTLAVDAIKSMATKVPDYTTIPNIIKITSSWFDSTRNIFKIKFIFDTTGLGKSSFKLAYTYSDKGYIRDSSYSIDAIVPKDQKRIETFALNLNDTSFIEFDFGNTLRFETKYYFALFIKPQNSDKYLSATDSSVTTISSGQMNWATVSMYATIPEVRVFENNVVIRQGEDWLVEKSARINDTLKYIRNVKKLNGFINVSSGVKFVKGNDVPAVYLGMKPDSIPEGFSIKDVRLYLCDTTFSGVYVVPGVQTQSSDSLVSALINTRKPSRYQDSIFVLLIDTIKPLVTQLDNFKTDVVSDMVNVSFKFDIKDNVSDIYVKFVASAWRDAGIVVMNQFVRDTVIDFDLPTGFVDQKSGLCASLIVSDGRFTDTINLSKTVATKLTIITIKEQWDPISVRYNLNNVKINHLVSLLNKDNKYDKTQFRIFKWEENPDKNPNPRKDKYLELDQVKNGDSTLFDLKPGNLLWLKTRESQTIVLDSLAKTMPMNDPVVVKIPRNQYVDFGMPFEYTVKLGDIARASQLIENGSNKNGLLSIYRWEKQGGIYKTELKYSDVANGDLLEGLSEDGSYTATFETPGTEEFLDLKIPAVPIARSTFLGVEIPKVSKQYVDKSNWNFKISSSDNNCVFTSIYAGFNPKFKAMGKIQIALPPTMSDIKVGFLDNSVMYGQSFAAKDEEGYAYTIRFVNNGNEAKIINCQLTENIPSGKFFKLFNSVTGELTDVSNGFSIPVAAGSSSDQILLAGSDQYIRKFASLNAGVEFALLQMYPNPFKGALTIKFTLPLTGVNLVTCRLFDALGRTVWNFNIDRDLKPGLNTFNWQPGTYGLKKLASGTYILKLTAEDVSGHKKGSGVSRLMYLAD